MKKSATSVFEVQSKERTDVYRLHNADKTKRQKNYTVTVVGLGYVGLPLALQALKNGYFVNGIDNNTNHILNLSQGLAPASLEEGNRKVLTRRFKEIKFSTEVVNPSDAFIICVPTPVRNDKTPDLAPLIGATELIAKHVRRGTLVVIESTVNPGVCEEFVLPIIEKASGHKAEKDFFFAHCPERINPGDDHWTVATIPRVLGTSGPRSDKAAYELYDSIIDGKITLMKNIKEAEAVKMVENSFRDINIAFVNELAMSFKKAGIDVTNVLKGASTKPFGFMAHYPGCGVGGHCIPVDPYYLIAYGKENGFQHRFLQVARDINNRMPEYTVSLLEEKLKQRGASLQAAKIALLGLSYKKDVPDLRESPALEIEEDLKKKGATVIAYDPVLPERSSARSLAEALDGVDGVIIATNHTVFEEITPETLLRYKVDLIVDGRNCLDKESFEKAGIEYEGIGR